ncbi:hypothetical protein ACFFQW_11445 [Umezawaea endophytica]|uniref:GDSL-like lipase/acylhydrolase family protein n=1 Tax=Umezawaea endophytica TaxID=1654476 RepID=A0A9X2VUE9_9PSEU|nr:hypothetical protein [Umezawaea endophytica]MCS7482547.1 hypothetical protein [Umezawaea endophytica]
MSTPARKARGPVPCTRLPRLLSVATTGAVFIGAGLGVMPASANPEPTYEQTVTVDVVGDSYMAGDGLQDTYLDPADPRHRSATAPALQALARVRSDNARLRVDANLVAASGARTADFFFAQSGQDNSVVNPPQRDQVRPDSQMVIVGFGGGDARLAEVLANAKRTTGGPNTALDKEIRALGPLLDWTASDEEYLEQAKSSPPGQAPTLVARMLQVLAGVAARAPHAEIVVTTYPLAADPQNPHATSLVGEDELTSVRKFGYDLNKAIDRAVRICACGSLADLAEAVAGHEIYTSDSVFTEQGDQQARQEPFLPNGKGASLIANPIADSIAKVLRIPPPKRGDGQVTTSENIYVRYGVSDRDGDAVADFQDRAPDDPSRSTDVRPDRDNGDDRRSSSEDSRSKRADDPRHLPGVLHPVVQVVDGLAPGVNLIGPHDRPPAQPSDEKHQVVVGSRPPAREQSVPGESTALALEPATAPPVPGEDTSSSWSRLERAAAEDVVRKAMPAGYVSMYSTQALRVAAAPAAVRTASDKAAVDRQMSESLQGDQAGFRARFGENIDAIHSATTESEQDAAIAQFDQTAADYNSTELAVRDVLGAHPVDARGETVRVTPTSLADLATETTLSAQTDMSTLAAAGSPKSAPAKSAPAKPGVSVESKPDFSVSGEGSLVGPGEASRSAEKDGVTATGKAEGKALGLEGTITGDVGPDGMSGKISGKAVVGEGTVGVTAKSKNGETGFEGKGSLGAEVGVGGKLNGINDFGLSANGKIGGTASVQDSGNYGLLEGSRKAEVGVGADFDAKAKVSPDGLNIGSHASLGAKAKAEAKIGVPGLSLDFTGTAFAGPGYDYGIRLGKQEDGKYRVGVTAGVSPLFGVAGGFDVTVDPDKLQQSVREAVDALNPFGPDQMDSPRSMAQDDPDYDGPTDSPAESQMDSPRSQAQNDPDYDGPTDSPADAPGESQMDSPRSQAQDDPGYDGPTDSPSDPLGESQMNSPRSQAQDDPGYDGPTDSPSDPLGESQMNSPRSQSQDDPGYDGPTDSLSDAAISSNTDPAGDTIAGYSGNDTLGGETGSDTLGGESDSGYSDSGFGDGSDTSGGFGGGDADASGGDTSDGGTGDGFSGGGGDFGGAGATGDFGGSDSPGTSGDSSTSDSGMGGDSGGFGGDSGMGGDSSGMGGDSSGGMGGDSSGGGDSGGDSGGGDGGGSDGGGGGDGGGDGGGSSSGGMGGGGMSSGGTGMGSGGMGGGPGGGDGGGF